METTMTGKTWMPKTAGILIIIAGAVGIGVGAWITFLGGALGMGGAAAGGFGEALASGILGGLGAIIGMFGAASIAAGIVAIVGGIFALRRRGWGLALAGSILAIFCMAPLGVLALIFLVLGTREFD